MDTDLDVELGVECRRSRVEGSSLVEKCHQPEGMKHGVEHTGMVGSMLSLPAAVWDTRSATVSSMLMPASAIRLKILSTESKGCGTRLGGEAWVTLERPARNSMQAPPGQLVTLTAPANWILHPTSGSESIVAHQRD